MHKLVLTILPLAFLAALPAHAEVPSVCPMIYVPVCAAQQVECVKAPCYPVYHTYPNDCHAAAASAPIIHEGACTDSESGPVKPQPPYTPPKGCIAWFDGCNICSIGPNGHKICTMRACMVYNILPGKCTAYATSTPPVVHTPAPATTTATSTIITATATPALPRSENGVLHRFIAWLQHLFLR